MTDGPPGEIICKQAKEQGASFIVVGSRGTGTIRRTILGSVSDYVLHHAHMPVVVVPKSVVWIRPTLPPPPPTPDPSDREKENARHLQLNICSRLFYGIKFISFILTRLKELYILQPRLQGLLVIQHGGDRREDPGTQRTKTIADWCFSYMDFDWLNLQKKNGGSWRVLRNLLPRPFSFLQWGRGCHPVIPLSV